MRTGFRPLCVRRIIRSGRMFLMGRKDYPDGLTREYCQAEKILLLG